MPVTGILMFQAHVCIEQTVIDLLSEDINVHILADGVSSRSLMDRGLALQVINYTLDMIYLYFINCTNILSHKWKT